MPPPIITLGSLCLSAISLIILQRHRSGAKQLPTYVRAGNSSVWHRPPPVIVYSTTRILETENIGNQFTDQSFCLLPRPEQYLAPDVHVTLAQFDRLTSHDIITLPGGPATPSEAVCSKFFNTRLTPRVVLSDPLRCEERYEDFTGLYCTVSTTVAASHCLRWSEVDAVNSTGARCTGAVLPDHPCDPVFAGGELTTRLNGSTEYFAGRDDAGLYVLTEVETLATVSGEYVMERTENCGVVFTDNGTVWSGVLVL